MGDFYERQLLLGSEHVDCFRRLKTSTLFELLQTASIRHTEELGMGREKTLDRGLLWVITRQHVLIDRWPVYDERVTVRSWPGDTMHVLFPRYYEILSEDGTVLIRAAALWNLIDMQTRSVAFPDEYGVQIAGVDTGREIPYISRIRALPLTGKRSFTVPYSYVDLNGHMNNTRYFDLVEDSIPASAEGRVLAEICAEYSSEARMGSELKIEWGSEDGLFYVTGSTDRLCFKMGLSYR
ncbi:MAG: hypothetical protein IKI65_03025 [Firmicutes bacterium]|nr:hypothetical protein [Bacillota bacterium]MBR6352121.1 hypothetical protein [Bacillota bacterium]